MHVNPVARTRLMNQPTKRRLIVSLATAVMLASGLTLTSWAKKGGGKPGGGGELPRYTQVDVGTLGGTDCNAYRINDAGQVVGQSTTDAEEHHAFLLIPDDSDGDDVPDTWFRDDDGDGDNDLMFDLGVLGVWEHIAANGDVDYTVGESFARGLNDCGQVVGRSTYDAQTTDGGPPMQAFVWDVGNMIDLGSLGVDYSEAYAINNFGEVVGFALDANPFSRAFLVAPTVDLDGNPVWYLDDDGDGINDLMIDLGTLGGPESEALFINDAGQVVGSADTGATGQDGRPIEHAFLITPEYDADGHPVLWFRDADNDGANDLMVDLGTLGGLESVGAAMNYRGQIAGTALIDNGAARAFLLTPEDTDGDEQPDRWFRDQDGDGANDLMTDLGTIKGTTASGSVDLNDDAQVVGHAWKNPGGRNNVLKRILWENGQIKDLDGLTDSDVSMGAYIGGINNAGQMVTDGGYILLPTP